MTSRISECTLFAFLLSLTSLSLEREINCTRTCSLSFTRSSRCLSLQPRKPQSGAVGR